MPKQKAAGVWYEGYYRWQLLYIKTWFWIRPYKGKPTPTVKERTGKKLTSIKSTTESLCPQKILGFCYPRVGYCSSCWAFIIVPRLVEEWRRDPSSVHRVHSVQDIDFQWESEWSRCQVPSASVSLLWHHHWHDNSHITHWYVNTSEQRKNFLQLTSGSKMVGSKHKVVIYGTWKQREDKDDLQNAEG